MLIVVCRMCLDDKLEDEFYRKRSGRDTRCRACVREYNKARRTDPEVRVRERQVKLANPNLAVWRANARTRARVWRKEHPEAARDKDQRWRAARRQSANYENYKANARERERLRASQEHVKSRRRVTQRMWREKYPSRYKDLAYRRYGITAMDYACMLFAQGWRCAICLKVHDPSKKRGVLFVDHDHVTGQVRGLLCLLCNSGLGKLGDSVGVLERAIGYLSASRGDQGLSHR